MNFLSSVGEAALSDLKTRPDHAVTVHGALVGFVELKAPGKGGDPQRFKSGHDKVQSQRHSKRWMVLIAGLWVDRGEASHRPQGLLHDRPMQRADVITLLTQHKPVLQQRFGLTKLALFGSFARDTARQDSDVDVLVEFDGPATSVRYFGVQFYLEDLLGRPVDLVTDAALRPRLRPYVERHAILV